MKKGSQRLALEAFSLILLVCDLVSVFFHCGVLVIVVRILFWFFIIEGGGFWKTTCVAKTFRCVLCYSGSTTTIGR